MDSQEWTAKAARRKVPRRGSTMSPKIYEEELKTEDEIAREKLGPRGVPGEPDWLKLPPPALKKEIPEVGEFDGHVA
jgi:hypothetical protein